MHSADELAYMRAAQVEALPGTAIIQGTVSVADGSGGYYEAYSASGTVAARLYPMTIRGMGSEGVGGAQIVSLTKWFITMPWNTVVDARDRISMEGRTWEVVAVNNDESWRTAIRAEVIANNEENRP